MADIDPASGLPKEMVAEKRDLGRINRLENLKARSRELTDDLNNEGGAVINRIKEHFLARVNTLISQDAECMAYKKLLDDMKMEINMGEFATERLLRLVTRTRKDTPLSE